MPAALLLIDGPSLWFRSYFGVPASITSPDGRPVNALRGFLDSLARLITRERPARLVICDDWDWRPQFRVDRVASYKAHRVAEPDPDADSDAEVVPDDLAPQVEWILQILDAFGIATAGAEGYEADDVLGTLAGIERRSPVVVASGDRDLLQVVTDDPVPVRVLYLGQGMSKAMLFGPAEVAERYGVPADRAGPAYAELALLRGDPSDGLPGVAGIGEKTAASLLSRYGSLEHLVAAAHDLGSALTATHRRKLLAAASYIEAAVPVVRVVTDAPVHVSTESDVLPLAARDPGLVAELAEKYGVVSALGRVQKTLDALPAH